MINFYDYGYDLNDREKYYEEIKAWMNFSWHFPFVYIQNIIKRDSYNAYRYAKFVIKCRWIEAEPYIMHNPRWAYRYAIDFMHGGWKEAEPFIKTDPYYTYMYAWNVIGGRWIEGEPIILTSMVQTTNYAIYVLKQRWLEAEQFIKINEPEWKFYCKMFNI